MGTNKYFKTLKIITISFILFTLIAISDLIPNVKGSIRNYTFRFTDSTQGSTNCNTMSAYFPSDCSQGTHDFAGLGWRASRYVGGNLTVCPYRITMNYSVHFDGSFPSNSIAPWFRISRCDANGNISQYGDVIYYSDGNGITNYSVSLEPYQGIYVEMNSGENWTRLGLNKIYQGYTCNFSVNYNIDDVKPLAPTGFGIQDNQQYSYNDVIYTKTNPLSFKWNKGVDQGNPVSAVDGYYLYYGNDSQWIDEPQTVFSDNKGWFSNEGKYTVQLKVKDNAGLLSDLASLTFTVDRTINQVTFPS
ncbi:MAG TPA: hypothetical protein VF531_05680, partial [Bacillota bacterium]